MTQTLKVDSDEAVRLARELMSVTGESLEAAVTAALKARLDRERDLRERLAKVKETTAELRALLTEPGSSDHSWLYDENGLPV